MGGFFDAIRVQHKATHPILSPLRVVLPVLLLVVVGTIWFAGINGPFLLDDFVNLEVLSNFEKVPDYKIINYLAESEGGILGRPISFLSFLPHVQDWPENPFPFKLVNVLLHLLSTVLVFLISIELCKKFSFSQPLLTALGIASVWALSPVHSSAVYYAVQRMALLSGFFSLLAIYIYIRYHHLLNSGIRGLAVLGGLIGVCFILAIFSKENGILIAIYLSIISAYFYNHTKLKSNTRIELLFNTSFIYTPLVALLCYMILKWGSFELVYERRNFTPIQRLITELEILLIYIRNIMLPRQGATGLFFENYPAIVGFSDMWRIGLALSLHTVILFLVLKYRKSWFAFGALWFYGGHLLESTVIPLELYFEHRNYLPSIGVVFIIFGCINWLSNGYRKIVVWAASVFVSVSMLIAVFQARLWNDEGTLVGVWLRNNPTSVRAIHHVNNYWIEKGEYDRVWDTYQRTFEFGQDNLNYLVTYMLHLCQLEKYEVMDQGLINRIKSTAREGKNANGVLGSLSTIIEEVASKGCGPLKLDDILEILENILKNPKYQYPSIKSDSFYLMGLVYSHKRRLGEAMMYLDKANSINPDPNKLIVQAYWLASGGLYRESFFYLQYAREVEKRKGLRYQRIEYIDSLITQAKEKMGKLNAE